jgi:hypothetical protein
MDAIVKLEWMDCFYVADTAARLLKDERPSRHRSPCLREPAVKTLRALWRSGNKEARSLVANRVLIWLDRRDRVKAVSARLNL